MRCMDAIRSALARRTRFGDKFRRTGIVRSDEAMPLSLPQKKALSEENAIKVGGL